MVIQFLHWLVVFAGTAVAMWFFVQTLEAYRNKNDYPISKVLLLHLGGLLLILAAMFWPFIKK